MPYSQSHQVGPIQSRPIIITGIICLKVYYHPHHMVWTFLGQLTCISPLFDIELLLTALVVNEKKKRLYGLYSCCWPSSSTIISLAPCFSTTKSVQ